MAAWQGGHRSERKVPRIAPAYADALDAMADSPMNHRRIIVVAICFALNALDGFDVLSISFASPGIAAQWGIDRAALGVVLSMELVGMTVGSLLLGRSADRFGRRPTTIICLAIMAIGMVLASLAQSVVGLSVVRLCTGVGIGGMLATTNAIVAETTNRRRRDLCVALMAGGYPVGAIVGGAIATALLSAGAGWRGIFEIGAWAALILMPLVVFLLPETVAFLHRRQPRRHLRRIHRVLGLFGLPPLEARARQVSGPGLQWRDLFSDAQRSTTILLTIAYLAHIMTFYFILKWTPKIVVDLGFAPGAAGSVLVWANVGGALGALALSLASQRFSVRTLCIMAMAASVVTVCLFGSAVSSLRQLALITALVGFFTNAGVVALYALMARGFPAELRGAGTGFVIGIGRGGSMLAPMVAGFLFSVGASLQTVAIGMAFGSLVAAISIVALKRSGTA